MGGFHSMHISKQYPDMFNYVGLFSAAIMPGKDVKSPIYDDLEGKLKTQLPRNRLSTGLVSVLRTSCTRLMKITASCWMRRVTSIPIMKPVRVISGRTGAFI
jgi:predicted alpha/beta superfamily hydrolase